MLNGGINTKRSVFEFMDETYLDASGNSERLSREEFDKQNISPEPVLPEIISKGKLLSATNLGKIKDKSFDEVIDVMTSKNYLKDKKTLSAEGKKIGIIYKENAKGNKWIVYPESLAELL